MKHTLKHFCRTPADLSVIEYVSPFKLCSVFLHEYIHVKYPKFVRNEADPFQEVTELEELFVNTVHLEAMHRKDFCQLLLELIQSVDMDFKELAVKILHTDQSIHEAVKLCWKRKMAQICSDPVSGLMILVANLDRMITDSQTVQMLHRLSVSGIFARKIILGFEKLSFTEVSNFSTIFKDYYLKGFDVIQQSDFEMMDALENHKSNFMPEYVNLARDTFSNSRQFVEIFEETQLRSPEKSKWTQRQSDLYVSKQVCLIQSSEMNADNPKTIEKTVQEILNDNPDLPQVHYLNYLNSLRVNDFCSAVKSLYWSFDRGCQCSEIFHNPEMDVEKLNEEADRGFRYAALNLAALHANFGHQKEAVVSALKEAIMMAQEANDHLCLQHALTWLFRVQPENRHFLMQRCIAKCNTLNLSYLTSLGIQSLSQVLALSQDSHGSPATVMSYLSKSDLLNCQHSLVQLILTSYAQKAAFWTMYGRGQLSSIISQLLLNIDSSDPSRYNFYVIGEASAIAFANIAKRLYDQGYSKECDLVLDFAKSVFPQESSLCGSIWKSTQIQIDFLRALHQTDWTLAEQSIKTHSAFAKHKSEILFMKLQLFLAQGNDFEASQICGDLTSIHEELSALDKVRSFLYQAEVFCLTANYPDAITPLMSAMKITSEFKLDYFQALVTLHTAHIQLQLGMSSRALRTVQSTLPIIFGHGSLFECSRARVLLAKCLVASSAGGRPLTFKAIQHLRKAFDDFMLLRAHHRAKDVLYLMVG